ncbi:hypothetical protein EAO70_35485 [Streptomyces sp. adm13(2018)]|uniref:hypothetical protein n=1 Tax=Streptomyces sp. adm13(2018) TaxID=2479007 RepID=UPI0011CDE336|nr:hypothetical protein [Streptomyces sp. adm13(2018)]TXS08093.1 hypothetical protein EAO70_35485 [Streptomyces sp. adm13(2018)]
MTLPTSPTGWLAYYRTNEEVERKRHGRHLPVDGWSPEGDALVVDRRRGARVPAASLPHFRGLQVTESDTVNTVPGQGWSIAYLNGATPDPVIAWAVDRHGYAKPLIANSDGYAEPWEQESHGGFLSPGNPDNSPYRPAPEQEMD